MAGPATLFQAGNHASRPANGSGCVLYSCTDHDLVYRDDGSSWTTFMTLIGGAGGDIATDTLWDAKGDIAGGTGANTAQKLTVGSNGQKLVAASGATTGLAWEGFRGARSSRTTPQTISTGTWTGIQMNVADDYDTDTIHDPSSNPSRFVAPVTGYYMVCCRANFDPSSTGDRYLAIFKSGSQWGQTDRQQANSSIGNILLISDIVQVNASQYLECMVHQDSGGNRDISSGFLSMALIGV